MFIRRVEEDGGFSIDYVPFDQVKDLESKCNIIGINIHEEYDMSYAELDCGIPDYIGANIKEVINLLPVPVTSSFVRRKDGSIVMMEDVRKRLTYLSKESCNKGKEDRWGCTIEGLSVEDVMNISPSFKVTRFGFNRDVDFNEDETGIYITKYVTETRIMFKAGSYAGALEKVLSLC